MLSLCKSVIFSTPDNCFNSSIDPTQTISSKSSLAQIGIGFPQNLFLLKHQSYASSNQLLNLPSWIACGTHLAFLLLTTNLSLIAVTLINQQLTAL